MVKRKNYSKDFHNIFNTYLTSGVIFLEASSCLVKTFKFNVVYSNSCAGDDKSYVGYTSNNSYLGDDNTYVVLTSTFAGLTKTYVGITDSHAGDTDSYVRLGYSLDIMRQTACLVVNPIIVDGYASLFNCTTTVRASVSMTASS